VLVCSRDANRVAGFCLPGACSLKVAQVAGQCRGCVASRSPLGSRVCSCRIFRALNARQSSSSVILSSSPALHALQCRLKRRLSATQAFGETSDLRLSAIAAVSEKTGRLVAMGPDVYADMSAIAASRPGGQSTSARRGEEIGIHAALSKCHTVGSVRCDCKASPEGPRKLKGIAGMCRRKSFELVGVR
jgi:hypothetical protein